MIKAVFLSLAILAMALTAFPPQIEAAIVSTDIWSPTDIPMRSAGFSKGGATNDVDTQKMHSLCQACHDGVITANLDGWIIEKPKPKKLAVGYDRYGRRGPLAYFMETLGQPVTKNLMSVDNYMSIMVTGAVAPRTTAYLMKETKPAYAGGMRRGFVIGPHIVVQAAGGSDRAATTAPRQGEVKKAKPTATKPKVKPKEPEGKIISLSPAPPVVKKDEQKK